MTKVEVHERPLFSHVKELLMGNEAIVKILHLLVVNILPHLAQAIKFSGFKVLKFAYNVCGWQVVKHNYAKIK
jgi:hypothetical protein